MRSRRPPPIRLSATPVLCMLASGCSQAPSRTAAPGAAPGPVAAAGDVDAWDAASNAARPGTERHAIDPVHTRIAIAVDHAGFSKAIGTISGSTGTVHLAPDSWEGAAVQVAIPLDRLDFGDEAWNRAVAAGGLLDSGRHPVARFHSTRVEALDARRARIHGELELRGVTGPVVLEAVRNGSGRHPLPPFRRTVGFSATATLSRAAFGSTAWGSMIGDTVDVRIELEATR